MTVGEVLAIVAIENAIIGVLWFVWWYKKLAQEVSLHLARSERLLKECHELVK